MARDMDNGHDSQPRGTGRGMQPDTSAWVPRSVVLSGTPSMTVRPVTTGDLAPLMATVGPLVASLYPSGAEKLLARLEDSINGYATARVVASGRGEPVALAAETAKGRSGLKLSTFWVHPRCRRLGIGTLLLRDRTDDWCRSNVPRVHVTVRGDRSPELERLFLPNGFTRGATVLDRYGDGADEVVLVWRREARVAELPQVRIA